MKQRLKQFFWIALAGYFAVCTVYTTYGLIVKLISLLWK